jgi:uncharacterized protein
VCILQLYQSDKSIESLWSTIALMKLKTLLLTLLFILYTPFANAGTYQEFVSALEEGHRQHFEGKYKEAFEIFSPRAAKGDDDAQLYLGLMYRNGDGVKQDYFKAFELFKKSSEQGNAWSQKHLAWMYIDGNGVLKDYKQAKYWFQRAYANDDETIRQDAKNAWDELELWKY